jgi:hypothetical protein
MLTGIRRKLTYANVMATIAVFMVVTGIGFAVAALPKKSIGPKQLKNGAVRSKKIHKDAVNASKIKKGAVGRSELANSAVGTGKISNQAVKTGKIANQAVTRAKVSDAAIPFLGTLRSGQELRGSFDVGGDAGALPGTAHGGYTFQFPLNNQPSAPATNVIDLRLPTPDPVTANCGGLSGGNQQTPVAAPGQLCVYITAGTNLSATSPLAIEGVTRLGFGLAATANAAGDFTAIGQWAVTAP